MAVTTNGIGNSLLGATFFKGAFTAALGGGFSGGYKNAALGALSNFIPSKNNSLGGGFSINLSPSIAFGTNGVGLGHNANLSFNSRFFKIGTSLGFTGYFSSQGGVSSGLETRFGYGVAVNTGFDEIGLKQGNVILAFGGTMFGGTHHNQRTGFLTAGTESINFTFDNDVGFFGPVPLGDNGDRWRTSGNRLNIFGVDLGLLMYTGDPGLAKNSRETAQIDGQDYYRTNIDGDDPNSHRLGALYIGFGNIRMGYNSESIRHYVQNTKIHSWTGPNYFTELGTLFPSGIYGGFYSKNPYTTW